ncbi:tRNA 2-selenouridine(34) synthase MnmH [Clostridium tarantellae]|uniref:tRNA 2-selenouridine(34) synthase MnmH n=1 Tax=Clostridium tarantellae TaxID=39493 RepID=A0A6I1MJJ6_9CLOT|nr:tRNA 2-selenouridine(34) synthase MnmH [Clostridium tarantellae]MPQ42322.1 tRNA 2-selenouridine(34) synthase MnmH [Clostridium tarantellae]
MFGTITYEEIYKKENDFIFIDVRSPKEAKEEPLFGAINIPVLLDDERDIVGTLYVRESVEEAKKSAVKFISKRLPEIFEQIQDLYKNNKNKKIVMFCARGGMRSGSLFSLLNSLGFKVLKLEGGYKAYRAFISKKIEEFSQEINFIVLYGNTGVGKTELLYKLKEDGFNTLDLEGCANHRGSILGGVGLGSCHTQKKFDSLVYEALRKRNNNIVFVEGESRRIGRILIPEVLFNKIYKGEKVRINSDYEVRAKRLVNEYTAFENVNIQLEEALSVLKKHISEENINYYKKLVNDGNYEEVALELMKKYYDPMYGVSAKKHNFREQLIINDMETGMEELKRIYNEVSREVVK